MSTTRTIQSIGVPFIKFQNLDKIEYLQDGKIYLKSLAYYRQREQETGEDTVGDLFEAMFHVNDGFIVIPEANTFEKLDDALINSSFGNYFAFCMLSFPEKEKTFTFSDEQKSKILDFGDSALLITNRSEFLRRITIALNKEKLTGFHGPVNYYDETNDDLNYWRSILNNGTQEVAFWKRARYAYQQEYRILIKPPVVEKDFYELDIGSIADISTILTAKQALDAIMTAQGEA